MAENEDDSQCGHLSSYDYYGFAIYSSGSELADEDCRNHEYRINSADSCSKTRDYWKELLGNWEQCQLFSPKQLRQYIKQGIPDDLRGHVWKKMIGSQAIKAMSSFSYQAKLAEIRQLLVDLGVSEYGGVNCVSRLGQIVGSLMENNKENIIGSPDTIIMTRQWKKNLHKKINVLRQIMLDIDRSFPSHKMFIQGTTEGKEGRAALFRVLAVYAMYNPEVSYCQGMSYIAGMFLMNMDEEDSFWCLVSMFERPKYLAGYFSDSLDKIQRHAEVFQRLMRQKRPALYKHLESLGVSPLMYLTPWFMALFTSLPCWDAVLMIWDLLLLDGMSVIFQAALAILDVISVEVLPLKEIAEALPLLLRPPANLLRREMMVSAIWKVKPIQKWEIDSMQAVLDEEKEKYGKRLLSDDSSRRSQKKQRTMSNKPSQAQGVAAELSLFHRFVGLFSSKENPTAQVASQSKSNDIEMTTFSFVSGQSPVVQPGTYCSATGRLVNASTPRGRGNSERPFTRSSRHSNEWSRRRSGSGRDVLRRSRVTFRGTPGGSPVRRSPRLASQQTPLGVKDCSPNTLIRSSARNQHAFRMFNTPTPVRSYQVRPVRPQTPSFLAQDLSPLSTMSPGLAMTPDVEMRSFGFSERKPAF